MLERDMTEPVRRWAISQGASVCLEFGTPGGVADLALVYPNRETEQLRADDGPAGPVPRRVTVTLAELPDSFEFQNGEFVGLDEGRFDYLLPKRDRAKYLKRAVRLGYLRVQSEDSKWDSNPDALVSFEQTKPSWYPCFSEVVGVELKLKRWKDAIAQTHKYLLVCDRCFVGLPMVKARAVEAEFPKVSDRVGLFGVDVTTGHVEILIDAPQHTPRLIGLRDHAAERILNPYIRGLRK